MPICSFVCFNPHTHEGCDGQELIKSSSVKVSIHTPTKGVTEMVVINDNGKAVSIHTPTKGVTWCTRKRYYHIHVSIHTPTKGVTIVYFDKCIKKLCFNPHTHEGCDRSLVVENRITKSFNPHTHEGCDSRLINVWWNITCFNPHTHEGCDYLFHQLSWVNVTFQSTHPRRVWRSSHIFLVYRMSFNPHTHEGCDRCLDSYLSASRVSIHTPTKGVTGETRPCYSLNKVSIHTPTKGVT